MADIINRIKAKDEMSGPLGQMVRNLGKFNQQCLSLQGIAGGVTRSLAGMATSFMGPAAAVTALTGAISSNIQTARQFQQSIAGLQSLTGMSGEALEDLKKKAIELGGSTTQSASQVAESFMLIGSKMPELLKDADALQTVTKAAIRLAEASGGDVTTSANALTAALNIMGEGASEAERYINVMAATSQQGTRNIQELTDIVFRAGQNARATGISFEELMAIAGAGTKEFASAEQAGQALGKLFLQLEKQGDNNLKPSVVGVTEAIKNLTAANFDTVTATKMFTKNGAAAYTSIIHNKDAILQLLPNIQGTNTALEQAEINTSTLEGSLNKLSSAWEEFNLTLNDSNSLVSPVIDSMTSVVGIATDLVSAVQDIPAPVKDAVAELGKISLENLPGIGQTVQAIELIKAGLDKYKDGKDEQPESKKKLSYNYRLGIDGWRQKNAKPKLIDEAPEFDDSTEDGIKAHIKYLKELRATADMAGREYGNLTAEITRLQALLKPPTVKSTDLTAKDLGLAMAGTAAYQKQKRAGLQEIADNTQDVAKRNQVLNGMQNMGDGMGIQPVKLVPVLDTLKEELKGVQLDPLTIDIVPGGYKDWNKIARQTLQEEENLEMMKKTTAGISSALGSASSAMGQFASESEGAAAAQKAFTIAAAIATLVGQFAAIPKGAEIWSWIAGTVAGVATLTATIASIKNATSEYHAEGGFVGSGPRGTDTVNTWLTPGELVLNASQQQNLASNLTNNGGGGGTATTTIKGEQLITVINNTRKRKGKGEIL